MDTLATVAALTGQKLSDDAGPDSFDVLSAWLGEQTATPPRDHLVLQNNNQAPLALRQGDWVLIQKGAGAGQPTNAPASELYNLATDLPQTHNLAAQQTERVQAMSARLETIRKQGRSRPQFNASGK